MARFESIFTLRDDFSSKMSTVVNSMNQGSAVASRFSESVKGVAMAGAGLFAGYKVLDLVQAGFQNLISSSDSYASTFARMNLMNDGLQTTRELQDAIYQAAQRSRTEYGKMNDVVAKLGTLAGHSFDSTKEVVDFAETMNKQFALGGASVQEQTNAMYQLTQAMASNRLQGDEYRSILENAPLLAQAIAKSMGVGLGALKQLSTDGEITGEVIKKALSEASDEINEKFGKLPITFGAAWIGVSNAIRKGLEPVFVAIGAIANNKNAGIFFERLESSLYNVAMAAGALVIFGTKIGNAFYDGVQVAIEVIGSLSGVLYAVIPALLAYGSYWVVANIPVWAHSIALGAATVATSIWAAVTKGATLAMRMLNVAIATNPIGMLVGAVVFVIAAFVAWQMAAGTLRDTIAKVFTAIMRIAETAINFMISWINLYIEAINKASEVFNKVFKSDVAKVEVIGKVNFDDRIASGTEFIQNFDPIAAIKSSIEFPAMPDGTEKNKIGRSADSENLEKTAKNTKGIKDALEIAAEDLKYLNDIADQKRIDSYRNIEIKVDMSKMQNNITKEADGLDIAKILVSGIKDQLAVSGEGV